MALTTPLQAEHQLDQFAGQLEHWRQTRPQAWAHIPEPLWAPAVALAAVLPPTRVAKQLRGKGAHLRRRLAAQPQRGAPAPPPGFVEVPLPPPHSRATAAWRWSSSGPTGPGCPGTHPTRRSHCWPSSSVFWRAAHAPIDSPKPHFSRAPRGFSQRDRWTRRRGWAAARCQPLGGGGLRLPQPCGYGPQALAL
jgi:hypothetical protein